MFTQCVHFKTSILCKELSDSEQAACQHTISPPFCQFHSQSRAGHCCSPGGLLAPTWPDSPPPLWSENAVALIQFARFPGHTSLWNKKEEEVKKRNMTTFSSEWKHIQEADRQSKSNICFKAIRWGTETRCSLKRKKQKKEPSNSLTERCSVC